MTDLVSHRGPDGEGFYNDEYISLGHRRLSIIDLSANGHQPMPRDNFIITYNGEVYNYLELKDELISLGHQFNTHSDTEVILASYQQWGSAFLNKLNGMFSFVIYDQQHKKVFAARDRFGVKPMYYWICPIGVLYIASEIKQFTCLIGWKAEINLQASYDFLNHSLLDHTNQTFFKDVFQLRPAHFFELNLGTAEPPKVMPVRWYELQASSSVEKTPAQFFEIFKSAIELRLRSDVPVGSCLSGGLDSSSIVCVLNQVLNKSSLQKTFSACSEIKKFDEREFIEEVVSRTDVEANYTYPDETKLFEVLDELIWHQDEPFGSTSIFAQWCVFELAKVNKVKVMLDGQGADEQLAGYHSYFPIYWLQLLKSFSWLLLGKELMAAKKVHAYGYLKSF